MYFKEKDDTNIDKYFKKDIKLNIKDLFNKFKLPLIIILGIILILVIILILINKKPKEIIMYFLELEGDTNITLYKGSEYIEAGYTAYDSKGNNLDNEVIVTNNLDTSNIGTYVITYLLHDISKERNINVIEKPIGATYIHLLGNSIIYLKLNEKYKEPGYLVTDTVDSNLKDKVKIASNINSKEPGIYKVTYTVTNSSGVTTSASRKVIVMSSDTSLSLDNSEPTNNEVGINIHVVDNYFDYLILPNKEKITSKDYTYKVSENDTYKFTIYNKEGSHSEETIKVTNIDKTKPTGSCTGYIENGKSYITITATDDIGISKYLVNNITSTSNVITLNNEIKDINVTIYDKAGNTGNASCTLVAKKVEYYKSGFFANEKYNKMTYRLYIPPNTNKYEKTPLVVVLHGGYGGSGNCWGSTDKGSDHYLIRYLKNHTTEATGAIVIGPRSRTCQWHQSTDELAELIRYIIKEYNIDTDRISLGGHSQGGAGSLELLYDDPSNSKDDDMANLFSVAVINSPASTGEKHLKNDNYKTPIWIFYANDESSKVMNYCKELDSLWKNTNGKTTIMLRTGHSTDPPLFNNSDILKWMVSQRKSNPVDLSNSKNTEGILNSLRNANLVN